MPAQFFRAYVSLLESSNYVTRRQSLKVPLHRSDFQICFLLGVVVFLALLHQNLGLLWP